MNPEEDFLDGGAAPAGPGTADVFAAEQAAEALDAGPAGAPDDQPAAPPDSAAEDGGSAPTEPS